MHLNEIVSFVLYLLQYPVRPADITYDNIPHIGARIKPEQQKVTQLDGDGAALIGSSTIGSTP